LYDEYRLRRGVFLKNPINVGGFPLAQTVKIIGGIPLMKEIQVQEGQAYHGLQKRERLSIGFITTQ
jgi:hypothetical protein